LCCLDLADAGAGRIEHEQADEVVRREKPRDRLDVRCDGRFYLLGLLQRELHAPVTRRVRRRANMVEHHREDSLRLADAFPCLPIGCEHINHALHVFHGDLVIGLSSKNGVHAIQRLACMPSSVHTQPGKILD
jgi:hypothetical protein